MKKFIALLLAAMLLFALAACSDEEFDQTTDEPETVDGPKAEVTDGSVDVSEFVQQFLTSDTAAVPAFTAESADGSTVTEDIFAQNELTMINFWEPWCGPCVGEMPDLELLYENYKDRGFTILGVHSTEDGAADVLDQCGITYPVISYQSAFDDFQTGYVPTTVFVGSNGETVSLPVAGSSSYDGWAEVVEYYLG